MEFRGMVGRGLMPRKCGVRTRGFHLVTSAQRGESEEAPVRQDSRAHREEGTEMEGSREWPGAWRTWQGCHQIRGEAQIKASAFRSTRLG